MAPIDKKGRGSSGKASASASSSGNATKKRPAPSTAAANSGNKASPNKGSSNNNNNSSSSINNSARKTTAQQSSSPNAKAATDSNLPTPAYLISCDIPTKQYIQYLNEQIIGGPDKKFILQDLDATHLLIKPSARADIDRKLDIWFDENIFSAIEKVGEDFDMS